MALRSLVGKLRVPPPSVAASRAFSQKCEYCGKTSSRVAVPLGQKNGAIKIGWSKDEMENLKWKHYMIRVTSVVTSLTFSWLAVEVFIARLEDEGIYLRKK